VYSNNTARPHADDVAEVRRQMAQHLVRPVEFAAEIEAMHADGARVFLEVGPKSVLSRLASKILEGRPHSAIALDDGTGLAGLLNGLAQLACAGVAFDVARLFAGRSCRPGDPGRLETLSRQTEPSKHAWMLNGSVARRAFEPVTQVGVRLGEVAASQETASAERRAGTAPSVDAPRRETAAPAMPATSSPATAAAAMPSRAVTPPAPARAATLPARWNEERQMDKRRPPPDGSDPVMIEYFETMREFLVTQERVMSAYLGDATAAPGTSRGLRTATPVALPRAAHRIAPTTDVARHEVSSGGADPSSAKGPIVVASMTPLRDPAKHANGTNGANGAHAPETANGPSASLGAAAGHGSAATNGAADAPLVNGSHAAGANGSVGAANGTAGGAIGRAQLTDMLLAIVEDKTGYPRDMVGLDQGLEADLGIDSIKRVEVVGAMLQALPDRYREGLAASRSQLNTQQTLNGVLEMLCAVEAQGAASRPFEGAETGTQAARSLPSRHVIVAEPEALDPAASKRLSTGHFLVTDDGLGLAPALIAALTDRGCGATLVPREVLASETRLGVWTSAQRATLGSVTGIVHAAPAGAEWLPVETALEAWRAQLTMHEKSLFLLLQGFADRLAPDAQVLGVSALGGSFGRLTGTARGLSLQGGAVGLVKSLREEWPGRRAKAIDVDRTRSNEAIAADLLAELEAVDGRQEVGYPGGLRTVFRTRPADARDAEAADPRQLRELVVLCTGGARGVTAEALRELALPGNTLVVTGRTPLADEDAATVACTDARSLRDHFVAAVRDRSLSATPAEIDRRVRLTMGLRELRRNLDDFKAHGARVEYHAVDVTDDTAMAHLVAGVEERHGFIGGVVHGAGVIEDRLLVDKTSDSWSRVVETKVLGLLAVLRLLRPERLRFLSVFSSVAGRYGNSGQTDYATANELMNRLCCQVRDQWSDRVNVSALCWGPWGPTTFGSGMVTAEVEAKFAAKGVALVDAGLGRRLFTTAVSAAPGGPVEIICGQGEWEAHEAAAARPTAVAPAAPIAVASAAAAPTSPKVPELVEVGFLGPLIGRASVMPLPLGEQRITLKLDARHAYLSQHRIDGVAVLPAAAAMELMAEAAQALWPGWNVVEARDVRLIKGVEVKDAERTVHVVVTAPPYGSSEGFDVSVALRSDAGDGRSMLHYRCGLRLEQQLATGFAHAGQRHDQAHLSVAKAYDELLFHGPCFQVIEAIDGLSDRGASARVRSTRPCDWLAASPAAHEHWIFDPALVDAAAQMALLWARTLHGQSCLPARFGRVARLRETLPARLRMAFERTPTPDPHQVAADVYFLDESDQAVMLIEGMECVGSTALNRLGGTAARPAIALSA
jgi:NAD(P)-dependent dehydrogenase (short-subunit alcohol dehydrogenase family)